MPLAEAFELLHRPTDVEQPRRALRRFRFEEAFVLQTALAQRRSRVAGMPATTGCATSSVTGRGRSRA